MSIAHQPADDVGAHPPEADHSKLRLPAHAVILRGRLRIVPLAEITTIASLGTAGGTLVLAVATFASTRSANRAARVAERSLVLSSRPTLVPSRPTDPVEEVDFIDDRLHVPGGSGIVIHEEDRVLLAMALRNVGSGLAVLQGWFLRCGFTRSADHADPDGFRETSRDIYIAAGDTGFWQGAVRDNTDPLHDEVRRALDNGSPFTVELLYTDQEDRRFVTRFALRQMDGGWTTSAGKHWVLDQGPAL